MTTPAEKRNLVITRVFDAPVQAVWKAWTDSQDIMQWWGPTGFTCPLAEIDLRVGGTSLVCMRAPADFGGQDMYSTWTYQAIVPMQQIDFIHNLADEHGQKVDPAQMGMPPDFPQDQRQTITFRSMGDQQTELTVTEYDWTVGHMMEMSEMGMNQCLDKMVALFV
jgi:uncharacterized protein YndB with AHSA1/START domain